MSPKPSPWWSRVVLIFLAAAAVGAGAWFAATRGKQMFAGPHASEHKVAGPVAVEVASPKHGGIDRMCVQSGTVEPFESADLYAKASGFLVEQKVDIGSRVTKGDVLARIAVPEYEKQMERDRARVKAAEAKVRQMEAHRAAAESEAKAAEASVTLAKVLVRSKTSYRKYREKQLARFRELADQKAITQQVVDEQEDFYLSAQEAESAGTEAVNAAAERVTTAKAKISQAQADIEQAKAEVGVVTAEQDRTQVFLDYAVLRSPYTGVVTRRSFHVGDFVKSADQSGSQPLLCVERTDVMRVIVQVPDRDIPYVSLDDPAVIEIDALPGVVFESRGTNVVVVSRWAESEDPTTRTMRTEIDVKNPDNRLRRGMYGRATLTLQTGAENAVRVPTAAVASRTVAGKGTVRVVRDGHIHTVAVVFGADNGVEVEVLTGLTTADRVVVRATGPVDDGAAVAVAGAKAAPAGH